MSQGNNYFPDDIDGFIGLLTAALCKGSDTKLAADISG